MPPYRMSRGMDDYELGYRDGYDDCMREGAFRGSRRTPTRRKPTRKRSPTRNKPRKLSGWQKFIKNKRNHIKFKSGSKKGRLNLKAMAVKFRKTPAGKKKKR